jgi:magnesium chelatase family protein
VHGRVGPGAGAVRAALVGELGLDGQVRPARGVLPMVVAASRAGITRVIVPGDNAGEARSSLGCGCAA